jgi:putative DNA-invertase from lambdoid prophage Rac
MVMHTTKKCIGYARVSTDKQESQHQIDQMKNIGVSIFFSDEGISGTVPARNRPEYKRMITYLQEHKEINTLVVFELSRIGRDLQDSINELLNFEKAGIRVWSVSEQWTHADDPGQRQIMIMIVSWLNSQALDIMRKRIRSGIQHAKLHGTKSGKPIGKPRATIDKDMVMRERAAGMSWHKISVGMNINPVTLYRARLMWKAKELGRDV